MVASGSGERGVAVLGGGGMAIMLGPGASRKRVRHSFARSVALRPSVPHFHPSFAVAPTELSILEPAPWDRSRDADMALELG